MANVKGPRDHTPAIEKLAGQKLQDPNATKDEKRLAAAVLAHADGKKEAPKPVAKPAPKAAPKPAAKAAAKAKPAAKPAKKK